MHSYVTAINTVNIELQHSVWLVLTYNISHPSSCLNQNIQSGQFVFLIQSYQNFLKKILFENKIIENFWF